MPSENSMSSLLQALESRQLDSARLALEHVWFETLQRVKEDDPILRLAMLMAAADEQIRGLERRIETCVDAASAEVRRLDEQFVAQQAQLADLDKRVVACGKEVSELAHSIASQLQDLPARLESAGQQVVARVLDEKNPDDRRLRSALRRAFGAEHKVLIDDALSSSSEFTTRMTDRVQPMIDAKIRDLGEKFTNDAMSHAQHALRNAAARIDGARNSLRTLMIAAFAGAVLAWASVLVYLGLK